jgi:hypothetical protein
VAAVLQDENACGYPPEQLLILHDDTATKEGILRALDKLAITTTSESTIFLFYCGHGALGTDGNYHLFSHDVQLQDGRVVAGTGVSEAEVLEKLRAIQAQRLLMIIDACYSGHISPSRAPQVATRHVRLTNPPEETVMALLGTGSGRIIITSCRESQVSYIGWGTLSIFTQVLVDALRGKGVRNNQGMISAFSLYEQLYAEVKAVVAAQIHAVQEPELTILKGVGPFAVSLYKGASSLGEFVPEPLPEGSAVRETSPEDSAVKILTQGVTADYVVRIENFLSEYLVGAANQPVPFGGRDSDLDTLNTWLDDEDASPYLLLTAPAGRGKSALLANWSQQLLTKDNLEIVFIPISIRFSTNLFTVAFAVLAARLAFLHGEKVPTGNMTGDMWYGLAGSYLSRPLSDNRRLLIILDGLDEAADWRAGPSLFPLDPHSSNPNLRVVVSTRFLAGDTSQEPWLNRLGWNRQGLAYCPNLAPLSIEGVADVLIRMGFPLDQLGKQVDIVSQLFRLSEGDPLLVRLYVDDLWSRGKTEPHLRPTDLGTIPPGLNGYFKQWWDYQRELWGDKAPLKEQYVQVLLNLLACALGPLTQTDLLYLAPEEANFNAWILEEALQPLMRYIIGDGREQGYVFSHPRLGIYLYCERLTPVEREQWEGRFLNWGRNTLISLNEGRLEPNHAPSYLIQYYGAHLERMQANVESFSVLVSDGWRQAWYTLEGAYSGFLNDVARAWRVVGKISADAINIGNLAPLIGDEVLFTLCRVSVNTLAKNIPSRLLIELIEQDIWTSSQALTYTRSISDQVRRVETFITLIPKIKSQSEQEQVIWECLEIIQVFLNSSYRASGLLVLLSNYLPYRLLKEALSIAHTVKDVKERIATSAEIIGKLPTSEQKSNLLELLALARTNSNHEYELKILLSLIPYLSGSEQEDAFESILNVIQLQHGYWQYKLIDVLPVLSSTYRSKILAKVQNIKEESDRISGLIELIPYMPNELMADVLQLAQILPERTSFYSSYPVFNRNQAVIRTLRNSPAEQWPMVNDIAQMFDRKENQAEVLIALATHARSPLREVFLLQSLDILKQLRSTDDTDELWVQLLPQLNEIGYQEDALFLTKNIRHQYREHHRSKVIVSLAPYLSEPLLEQAFIIVRKLQHHSSWSRAMVALIPKHAELVDPIKALEMVHELFNIDMDLSWYSPKAWAIAKIIAFLPESLQTQALDEALTAIRKMWVKSRFDHDTNPRAEVMMRFLNVLPEKFKRKVVMETLAEVQTIRDDDHQAVMLTQLSPYLSEVLLIVALSAARSASSESHRARALRQIIPFLPDELLPEALKAARSIQTSSHRVTVLNLLTSRSTNVIQSKLLRAAKKTRSVKFRIQALLDVLPSLPHNLQQQTVGEILEILPLFNSRQRHLQIDALIALEPYLSGSLKYNVFSKTLKSIQEIQTKKLRIALLARLAPYLPDSLESQDVKDAVKDSVSTPVRNLSHNSDKETKNKKSSRIPEDLLNILTVNNIEEQTKAFNQLPRIKLYSLWQDSLNNIIESSRKEALEDLGLLAPVIFYLGGDHAIETAFHAVQTVEQWWP